METTYPKYRVLVVIVPVVAVVVPTYLMSADFNVPMIFERLEAV